MSIFYPTPPRVHRFLPTLSTVHPVLPTPNLLLILLPPTFLVALFLLRFYCTSASSSFSISISSSPPPPHIGCLHLGELMGLLLLQFSQFQLDLRIYVIGYIHFVHDLRHRIETPLCIPQIVTIHNSL